MPRYKPVTSTTDRSQVSAYIPGKIRIQLEKIANQQGISMSELVRRQLAKLLKVEKLYASESEKKFFEKSK